jgi:hypothetical protein
LIPRLKITVVIPAQAGIQLGLALHPSKAKWIAALRLAQDMLSRE